jgi:hypothetical protein
MPAHFLEKKFACVDLLETQVPLVLFLIYAIVHHINRAKAEIANLQASEGKKFLEKNV